MVLRVGERWQLTILRHEKGEEGVVGRRRKLELGWVCVLVR